jgi:hypothetical protein
MALSKRDASGETRRVADPCNRLDGTWDFYATGASERLTKLPREFQRFQPTT